MNAPNLQEGPDQPAYPWEMNRRMPNTGFLNIAGWMDRHRQQLVQKDLIVSHDGSTIERWTLNKDSKDMPVTDEIFGVDRYSTPEVNFWRSEEEDDGWSSDNSSDLFELPNGNHVNMYCSK